MEMINNKFRIAVTAGSAEIECERVQRVLHLFLFVL